MSKSTKDKVLDLIQATAFDIANLEYRWDGYPVDYVEYVILTEQQKELIAWLKRL